VLQVLGMHHPECVGHISKKKVLATNFRSSACRENASSSVIVFIVLVDDR
jgi:hypothetical protein